MLARMLVLSMGLLAWSAATAVAAAPVSTTDLLHQAMEQERAISRCTAVVETQHAMEFDGDGRVKPGRELLVVRRFTGTASAQSGEVLSARRSGQDVTGEFRKDRKTSSELQRFRSPFHPEVRPLYMFLRADSTPAEPMRLTFHPTYAHRDDPGLFEGMASFDRATGRILEWTAHLVHPPTFVNRAEVHVIYGARVGLLDARSQVSVALEGGLLFYKRRGRMDFQLSDYACPESMPPSPGPAVSGPSAPPPARVEGERADRGS